MVLLDRWMVDEWCSFIGLVAPSYSACCHLRSSYVVCTKRNDQKIYSFFSMLSYVYLPADGKLGVKCTICYYRILLLFDVCCFFLLFSPAVLDVAESIYLCCMR